MINHPNPSKSSMKNRISIWILHSKPISHGATPIFGKPRYQGMRRQRSPPGNSGGIPPTKKKHDPFQKVNY
jgi:hypothetical protein